MSTQIQRRRGTTAEHSTFTGVEGELTVDTTKDTVVVHDGATTGGRPLLREDQANLPSSVTNGLYTPGTNQVALSTGGTGRLFVDASGNINIRKVSASLAFVGSTAYSDGRVDITRDSATPVYINRLGTDGELIAFYNDTVAQGGIQVSGSDFNYAAYNAGALLFSTNATERVRITSDGKLGVGTSAPLAELQINAITPTIRLEDNGGGAKRLELSVNSAAEAKVFASQSASQLLLGTTGTERLRITADGKVGVGTSAPSSLLEVSSATTSYIRSSSTTNSISGVIGAATSSFDVGTTSSHAMNFYTAGVNRATLDTSGRLGIGTTSPSAILDVKVASDAKLLVQDGNATGNVKFNAVNNAVSANVNLEISASNTQFFNGGSERARIDSSGRLLVGTSSGRSNIAGTAQDVVIERASIVSQSLVANQNASGGSTLSLCLSRGTAVGSNTIVQSGDIVGTLAFRGNDGTNFLNLGSIKGEVDGTPGANDMPGRLVFSTTADGASAPTERMRIGSDGQTSFFGSGSIASVISSARAAGTTDYIIQGRYGATGNPGGITSFQVFTNGDTQNTNNSYAGISDIKLKENIVDANSQWDDIKALQVRNYNFKEGQTHTQIGLIAQEVELVSPGLVSESPDRDADGNDLGTVTKSVNYSVLYMKAVKALQEAMERIETLEAKVAALESA